MVALGVPSHHLREALRGLHDRPADARPAGRPGATAQRGGDMFWSRRQQEPSSRRSRESGRRATRTLLRETQAFLDGSYAEQFVRKPRMLPAWAVINPAAHGDLARLRALAASRPDLSAMPDACVAVRALAREVLLLVEDDQELLTALQTAILRPLELELIAACSRTRVSTRQVVSSARAVLRAAGLPPRD
jgi:hypothetical protein